MKFFKQYYILFVFILALCGVGLIAHSNNFEIGSKTIECVIGGELKSELLHFMKPRYLVVNLVGQLLISLSMAIFIALFFVKHLDDKERNEFQEAMLEIQNKTSKDAIESIFNRIIDERFFKIIKDDLLSAKLIRKNVTWKYDITEDGSGTLKLKRIISYKLHNISSTTATETLHPTLSNNSHSTGNIIRCVVEKGEKKEGVNIITSNSGGYISSRKTITIEPGEYVSILIIMEQVFKNGYIYETHFTTHPIINLDIIVNFPSAYNFNLQELFSSKCRLKIDEEGVKSYNVHGGIFKGQGIEFICEKANEATAT